MDNRTGGRKRDRSTQMAPTVGRLDLMCKSRGPELPSSDVDVIWVTFAKNTGATGMGLLLRSPEVRVRAVESRDATGAVADIVVAVVGIGGLERTRWCGKLKLRRV